MAAAPTKTVDDYIAGLTGPVAETARALRAFLNRTAPNLVESIKWGQPVYESDGPVCYFRAASKHVTFGFWRGVDLVPWNDRLESGGDRMAHMKLTSPADIDEIEMSRLIGAAIALNREKGSPTKRP